MKVEGKVNYWSVYHVGGRGGGEMGQKGQDGQFVPNVPGAFPFYGARKTIAELDIGSLPTSFSARNPQTNLLTQKRSARSKTLH